MNGIEHIALAKAKSLTQGARDAVSVGTHDVDMTVRIKGSITKGEDYDARKTSRMLSKSVLAHLIRCSGVTGPVAMQWVMDAMKAASEAPEGKQDGERWMKERYGDQVELLDAAEKREAARLTKLPWETHNGKVTAKLTVDAVDAVDAVSA